MSEAEKSNSNAGIDPEWVYIRDKFPVEDFGHRTAKGLIPNIVNMAIRSWYMDRVGLERTIHKATSKLTGRRGKV
nr:hypothetical protein [Candidatus Levybacteria bacterium]